MAMVEAGYYTTTGNEEPAELAETSFRLCAFRDVLSSCECEMRRSGDEESDEPRVVVQRLQRRHDQAAPRQRAADRGRANRAHVPAAIDAVRQIEIFQAKLAAPDQPIVGDQDAGDRSEPARVAEQPGVDVARRIG